ncbi:hypothetical protein R3P38DRAFT_3353987 [Favolaschia claudopus]|uniref:Transposase n=1 Tax=Favolaschia claudopus TaxID=2862362 RepID=A0AAV9ZFH3_9AGAR
MVMSSHILNLHHHSAMADDASSVRNYTHCTPTKRKALLFYKNRDNMSWREILQQPEFRGTGITKRTLQRYYEKVTANDENCYVSGRKDNPGGRPRRISAEALQEATNRLDSGELEDGEDVRRHVVPYAPDRTVRNSLARAGYPGFVQKKKPNLLPHHIEQRKAMWNQYQAWQDPAVFSRGIMIFSDEKKFILHGSDGRKYCRRPRGRDALVDRTVQRQVGESLMFGVVFIPWELALLFVWKEF